MKKCKRLLALLLATVLALGCFGSALAQDGSSENAETDRLKGFQSLEFRRDNAGVYEADDIVRAIVVLKGAPVSEVAERGSAKALRYTAQLEDEREVLYQMMRGIDFTPVYEYTELLNGFSCDVAYGELDAIAAQPTVDAVYIANEYQAPDVQPQSNFAGRLTGATGQDSLGDYGFLGQGTVIAVLDTGAMVEHEAFQVYENLKEMMEPKLSEEDVALAVAPGKYISEKIPFAYDYADCDNDVSDSQGHGTHCAGIALGYAEDSDGSTTFWGAAPAAQLLAMKIFRDGSGSTSSDIYFYAMEDAYRLGADVISMSIGAQNGFTYDESLETIVFGNIYERLSKAGIILCVAAGNEYSMAAYSTKGYITSEYTDYGTVATPSSYAGVVSVASMENYAYPMDVISIGNGTGYIQYYDHYDRWNAAFKNREVAYVTLGLGTEADFEGVDLRGKIAVIKRGQTAFTDMIGRSVAAGAVGLIVINSQATFFYTTAFETAAIPCVCVAPPSAYDALEVFEALPLLTAQYTFQNPDAFSMSDFSNWGTTPDLTICPTITGVGGMVYSAYPNNTHDYQVMSGTSMATPNIAGTFATLLSAMKHIGIEGTKSELAELAGAAMETTATVLSQTTGEEGDEIRTYYSVRKQGAGLANALNAFLALRSTYLSDPLQELGDDPEMTGTYTFTTTLVNNGSEPNTLRASAVVLRDALQEQNGVPVNTLTSVQTAHSLSVKVGGREVDKITVPAGKSVTVTVTIRLEESPEMLAKLYPNGTYLEGYVYFEGDGTPLLHNTFLAYFGDWTKGDVAEAYDWRDAMDWEYYLETTVMPTGAGGDGEQTWAECGFSYLDFMELTTDVSFAYAATERVDGSTTAFQYLGRPIAEFHPTEYNAAHCAISTALSNGSMYYADEVFMAPYLLRNIKELEIVVTDAVTGEEYAVATGSYFRKSVYSTSGGYWGYTVSWAWDGTDAEGNYVPSGTVATVTFNATLPYKNAEKRNFWSFDVTVDYTAPVLENVTYDPIAHTLSVTASDEQYLSTIYIADGNYNYIDGVNYSDSEPGRSHTVVFDIEGYDAEKIIVGAMDYATNEVEKTVEPKCYISDYSDCPEAWYHEAIDFVSCYGVMNGVGNGKFDPKGGATRAMIATVLWRAMGEPQAKSPSTFTDVPEGQWYSEAIAWAQENGIVRGVSETRFAPDVFATREEIAVMLRRLLGDGEILEEEVEMNFSDVGQISPWALDAMKYAVKRGWFIGDAHGRLNPRGNVTRAELAVLIMRAAEGNYDCPKLFA